MNQPLPQLFIDTPCINTLPTSVDFCKQFGPRSGPAKRRAWSGSKLFDTLTVFLKDVFRKSWIWKKQQKKNLVGIELNPNYETCGEKTHDIDIDIADSVIDDINAKKVGLNKYSFDNVHVIKLQVTKLNTKSWCA